MAAWQRGSFRRARFGRGRLDFGAQFYLPPRATPRPTPDLCPRETLYRSLLLSTRIYQLPIAAIRESRGRRQPCKHGHEDKSLNKKEAYRQLVDEAIARWIFNTMQSFDDGQDDTGRT